MPPTQSPFVSMALSRLRRAVSACCWIIAVALLAQVLIWAMATFMDVRHETVEANAPPAMIVTPHADGKQLGAAVGGAKANSAPGTPQAADSQAVDPNVVPSEADWIMAKVAAMAMTVGTLAMLMLIPMLVLGVLVAIGSMTPGVENAISAFIWALVLALLALPLGESIGLPWREGALTSYAMMTQQVDLVLSGSESAWGSPMFYARFAVLPLACVAGAAMIGLRFSSGIAAGIIPKESLRLDPVLEKEAANMKPGSLHGGRAGSAMRAAGIGPATERRPMATASLTQVAAGDVPRRLI